MRYPITAIYEGNSGDNIHVMFSTWNYLRNEPGNHLGAFIKLRDLPAPVREIVHNIDKFEMVMGTKTHPRRVERKKE